MNMKFLLIAVLTFAVVAGFLAFRMSSSAGVHNTTVGIFSSGIAPEAPRKPADPLEETGIGGSSTSRLTGVQAELVQDGHSILQNRCQACHMIQSLEAMKKNRTQWEKALTKMAGFGVELSDPEKSILLDYLAIED